MSIWTKVNNRNPVNRKSSEHAIEGGRIVRGRELAKETGPYKIIAVVGVPGGEQPRNAIESTGIHLVGIDGLGAKVRVQTKLAPEDVYTQVGVAADSYIGRLFKINKEGEAEFIDRSGTANMPGETLASPPNVIKSSMPISVMGVFGMNFPAIADVMSLLRRE